MALARVPRRRLTRAWSGSDGVLLVTTVAHDPLPGALLATGVLVVHVARTSVPVPVSFVDVANRTGGALVAHHLHTAGRRRLGSVPGPGAGPRPAHGLPATSTLARFVDVCRVLKVTSPRAVP